MSSELFDDGSNEDPDTGYEEEDEETLEDIMICARCEEETKWCICDD